MEIKVKVVGEKNQRCMKQQNSSCVECKVRRHSGREGLRESRAEISCCEPANVAQSNVGGEHFSIVCRSNLREL